MIEGELQRALECALSSLDRLSVNYHVTGGLASSYYGEPRLTQDIDLVVRLRPESVAELAELLEVDFLIQREVMDDAVRRRGMFQALHRELLIRIDFHVGERIEGELERSESRPLFDGLDARLVSKEDAILSKLLWVREGSEKSRRDIVGMLLDPTPFDRDFVETRAFQLGCDELFREIESESR